MANVIRLLNGGAIQVRTGVLQGIGPIGPRGIIGVTGLQGEEGPTGETGPMGAVSQYMTKAMVSGATSVATDLDTLVPFATVAYDDLSAATSSTNFTINEAGDYQVTAWVRFDSPANAGDGSRALWINSSVQGVLARHQVLSVADEPTYVQVVWPERFAVGEIIKIYARHSDDLAVGISLGAISVTRLGAGLKGNTGAGVAGPVGPAGAQGPQGPAGSANGGFTTYADLLA